MYLLLGSINRIKVKYVIKRITLWYLVHTVFYYVMYGRVSIMYVYIQ